MRELLTSRGMGSEEIMPILQAYKDNRLTSNQGFADAIGTLYPDDGSLAVLVYFYQQDSLRRILFEPGRVVEEYSIRIGSQSVIDLGSKIMGAFGIADLVASRSPRPRRGVIIENNQFGERDVDSLITYASDLLLPNNWDSNYRHVIIVPALNLGAFPFHLLRPFDDQKQLIDQCSYTIAPSILDVVAIRSRAMKKLYNINIAGHLSQQTPFLEFSRKKKLTFKMISPLFVANPTYPKKGEFVFPDLPGALREVDSALQFAQEFTLLTGENATKKRVLQAMNGSDLVYFATHGMASEEDPMNRSCLVLSEPNPYLTAKEIMDLRFEDQYTFPELVILSACQTGLGKSTEAGIVGLARPFLINGSSQVIMSLWNVDDDATSFLMTRFMHHMHMPYDYFPAEPLRQAMLETKKRFPKPEHWASFSVFGIPY